MSWSLRARYCGGTGDQALFDRLSSEHGIPWLVELTALIGHYGFVSGLLNAVEVAPAADAEQLPLGPAAGVA